MKKHSELTFTELHVDGYERVVEAVDKTVGLHAIIAIHSTTLGSALGGIRVYPYKTFEEALTDVCRLAEGMTCKAAIMGTGTGGAKAVIITDHKAPKSEALLLAFAEAVNYLEGQYICAEDTGITEKDMVVINKGSKYVVGLPQISGNPSPFTAWGVLRGIQATCMQLFDAPTVEGRTIAIQGLGVVGMDLARHLFWDGAQLIVADLDEKNVEDAMLQFGAKRVNPDEILEVECDILVPCAFGGFLNKQSIPKLRCKAVAGAANNQLLTADDGRLLLERDILYAPDFVINAAGLVNACGEISNSGYNAVAVRQDVNRIYDILLRIFKLSKEQNIPTNCIADEIVAYNLKHAIGKRTEEIMFRST